MLDQRQDLLDLERLLDHNLKHVSLIGEIPITDEDLDLLVSRLTDCLRSQGPGPGTDYLEDHGARVVVCFLVHLGVREYQEGDFWPHVTKALGRDLSPYLQSRWGGMVKQIIKGYRLTPFQDVGQSYVTPILGHGGIPDYCLGDFFEKLLTPVARGRLTYEGDVPHLLGHWEKRASDFQTADKPIHRFLRHGGRVARDFLDRCLEMVESYDAGWADVSDRFGLPGRVVERYREWLANRYPRSGGLEARVSSGPRYQRPELYLDPASGGLRLVVPCQSIAMEEAEKGRLTIFLRQDDTPRGEFPLRPSSVNGTVNTQAIDLPLRRSFARLDVALRAGPKELRNWDFDGITADHPWMAFDGETGRILAERPLPKDDVWLLAHTTMGLTGGDASEEVSIWGDFLAHRVDLGTSDGWRLDGRKDGSSRCPHQIEGSATIRPRLAGVRPPVWPAVSCPGCDSVFVGTPPDLVFPVGRSDPERRRDATLIVRSLEDHASLPTGHRQFALSDLLKGRPGPDREIRLPLGKPPLSLSTGRFLLNLRGRLGQDETYRVAVIPAMDIECPTACLYPDSSNESSPVTIRILHDPGIRIEPDPETVGQPEADDLYRIDLKPRQRIVDLKADGVGLRIALPRVEWAYSEHDEAMARFDSTPLELSLSELQCAAEPVLRLKASPGWKSAAWLELGRGGQSRTVDWKQGPATVPLKGFLDTIRDARSPSVTLHLVFGQGDDERRIEVLRVRRRWSCRLRSAETEIASGSRALFFAWDDLVPLPSRVIRLWGSAGAIDHRLDDGAEEVGFEDSTEKLPDGRYLMEFDTGDDEGWFAPVRPDYFKEGLQVIQLDASSVALLGSPAERLDELLRPREFDDPADPALRNRVVDDILVEPVGAERALRDRGWASLKVLFIDQDSVSNSHGDVEEVYGAVCWSDPRLAVSFLRRLLDESGGLECHGREVLGVTYKDGTRSPVEILYRARTQNDVRKNRPPRKRHFDARLDETRMCVRAGSWHCARPRDWSVRVKRFVLARFQRALCLGVASCPADARARIEEMGRQAFLSDPDGYLRALVDADTERSR